MDDDFDFENFSDYQPSDEFGPLRPREPEPQQQAPAPPRWTAADNIRYAKKAAGLNQVRDDLDAGVLYPQHAEPIVRDLTNDLNQMDQQKAAFDGMQQQSATQAALGQNAMARAVQQADQNHAADGFLSTMRTFIDPVSGQSATFFQAKPGQWTQVALPDAAKGGDTAAAAGPESQGPPGMPADFEQTIQNGPWIDKYRGGQLIQSNRPQESRQQGGAGGEAFGLSGSKMGEIDSLAEAAAMHIKPGVQRDALKSHVKQRLIMSAIQERAASQRQTAINDRQAAVESSKQVETDYRDALKSHPLRDYQDAADPHAARMAAIMSDFGTLHPDDKRVQAWTKKASDQNADLAKRDPATMSLGQLATATMGAHANVQRLIQDMEKEVKADGRVIPADTERGGVVYNPADGGDGKGVYKDMHPEGIHAEAERRVRSRLEGMLKSARAAKGQKSPSAETQPDQPPAQPQAASQPAPPQVEPLPDDVGTIADIQKALAKKQAEKRAKLAGPAIMGQTDNSRPGFGARQ